MIQAVPRPFSKSNFSLHVIPSRERLLSLLGLMLGLVLALPANAQQAMFLEEKHASVSRADQSATVDSASNLNTNSFKRRFSDASLPDDSYYMDMQGDSVLVKRMHLSEPVGAPDKSFDNDSKQSIDVFYFAERRGSVVFEKSDGAIKAARIYDAEAQSTFVGNMSADGQIEFVEQDVHDYICINYDVDNSTSAPLAVQANPDLGNEFTVTEAQLRSLESRPNASRVLFIDYWGGVVSGTAWNADNMGRDIVYEPYNSDGNSNSFSRIELQRMYVAWAEAAEDYAPFDVNVTTDISVFNSVVATRRSRIIATPTTTAAPGAGGVAYVDVFGLDPTRFGRSENYYSVGWTFNSGFTSMGMTHSHEAGHQMGLRHDGDNVNPNYYSGHSNWGPVMGAPFGKDYVQWSKGDYLNANRTENDLEIIEDKLTLVSDDAGNSNADAASISIENTQLTGLITPAGLQADIDVYELQQSATSTVSIDVRSFVGGLSTGTGPNLSLRVQLRNGANVVIAEQGPTNNPTSNAFTFSQSLAPGRYYLSIRNQSPDANPITGFDEYGNGGYYRLSVSGGIINSGDDDGDTVQNHLDNCPTVPNPDQLNTDGDSQGNACDDDDDNDNRNDNVDNCPLVPNTNQANLDNDSQGDACDLDDDNDGRNDNVDNCPRVSNGNQLNTDGDSQGNACDADDDNDTRNDNVDNCPLISNRNQANLDGDSLGDVCDPDDDNDGRNDNVDNCPRISNPDQANFDRDALGDVCDPDDDNDSVADISDNCPFTPNRNQANFDRDADGDACDNDIDNDGAPNGVDSNSMNPRMCSDNDGDLCDDCSQGSFDVNNDGPDADADGICDVSDLSDSDGDTIADKDDNCPKEPNADQADTNNNGIGDACEDTDICFPITLPKGGVVTVCL